MNGAITQIQEEACIPVKEESQLRRQRKRPPDEAVDSEAATKQTKKPKTTKEVDREAEFATSWICTECKEAECMMQPEATELIVCDGPCRRLFHYPCAGLSSIPPEDEPFFCYDCQKEQHICSICLEYGIDGEDVFKCKVSSCGLFYHESCLAMNGVPVQQTPGGPNEDSLGQRTFKCPAHHCWTCTQEQENREEQKANCPAASNGSKRRGKKKKTRKTANPAFQCKSEFLTVSKLRCATIEF